MAKSSGGGGRGGGLGGNNFGGGATLELSGVRYKNPPKVYGLGEDITDGAPLLKDTMKHIKKVDGVDTNRFKKAITNIVSNPYNGYVGKSGKISDVRGLLGEAYYDAGGR